MAIVLSEKKNKQTFLIILLLFAVVLAGFIFWQEFIDKEVSFLTPEEPTVLTTKEIKIDLHFFQKEKIKQFELFSEIEPLEEWERKENPFLP